MVIDNKMVNRMAQDALVCAPTLKQVDYRAYYMVSYLTKAVYAQDKYGIQSTFRFMKMCLFLNKVILFGLGYINSEELYKAYNEWYWEDKRYWNHGDLEATYEGWYYVTMHPALNHRKQLPMY